MCCRGGPGHIVQVRSTARQRPQRDGRLDRLGIGSFKWRQAALDVFDVHVRKTFAPYALESYAAQDVPASILCGIEPPAPHDNRWAVTNSVIGGVIVLAVGALAKVIGKLSLAEIVYWIAIPGAGIALAVGCVIVIRNGKRSREQMAIWQAATTSLIQSQGATIDQQATAIDELRTRVAHLESPSPTRQAAVEAFLSQAVVETVVDERQRRLSE